MADETSDSAAPPSPADDGRRKSDRRQSQQAYEGPDRRKGERRSGTDRRTAPRTTDNDSAAD